MYLPAGRKRPWDPYKVMDQQPQTHRWYKNLPAISDHPFITAAFLAWGLFVAIVWATARDDVYLIAKAGEIVALALGKFLIERQIKWFFGGLLATGLALPVALYTTTPIFWGSFLPILSGEFFEVVGLGGLCGLPLLLISIWGLRRPQKIEPPKPDPRWIKGLNHLFKWTLAGMLFSFHIANPPLIILGILVFLGGMICLATVRLHLTLHHVGNLLILVGGGTVVIAILLIPLGIAHVDGAEAAMAVIPGVILAILGFFLRVSRA